MQVSSSLAMSVTINVAQSHSFSMTRSAPEPRPAADVAKVETPKIEAPKVEAPSVELRGHKDKHDHAPRYGRGGFANRVVARMDSNRDGGVSLEELRDSKLGRRMGEEKFAQVDSDSDGLVTAKELRSHMRQSLFPGRGMGAYMNRSPNHQPPAAQTAPTDAAGGADSTSSAGSVAQIASAQALATATSVSVTKVEASFVSVSYEGISFSAGGSLGSGAGVSEDAAEMPQQLTAEAPTELAAPAEKKPTAAMLELEKIEAEAAAEEAAEADDAVEIDDLGDLLEMFASGDLDDLDPMKLIEELAELAGFEFDAEGDDDGDDDGMSIGSLSSDVDASFASSEVSLEAFSFEASMTTATLADGSSYSAMSVSFTAISAYSRTMELSAAA